MRPVRRRGGGFTLVELMIVVAIIGIVGAFLFSTLSTPTGANGQTMTDDLKATLGFARTRAIATRRIHRVTFDTDATTGEQTIQIDQAAGTGMTWAGLFQAVQIDRVPTTVWIWAVDPGAGLAPTAPAGQETGYLGQVEFKPDGSATPTTIYVKDRSGDNRNYRILVFNATGSTYARKDW